jgi:hypothetical protein
MSTNRTKSRQRIVAIKAATGGSVLFDSIPSWVKRIRLDFLDISMAAATSALIVRIGTASGLVATGYLGSRGIVTSAATAAAYNEVTGHALSGGTNTAAGTINGNAELVKWPDGTWVFSGQVATTVGTVHNAMSTSRLTLAGALTQLAVVADGSTFDSGQIAVSLEAE